MANVVAVRERGALPARPARRFGWAWLGLLPFFLFSILFMFLPTAFLVAGSLQKEGQLSLQNYADLQTGIIALVRGQHAGHHQRPQGLG